MEAIKLMISEEQEEMFLKQFYQIATKAIEKAQENAGMTREYLNQKEMAEYLNVSENFLKNAVRNEGLPVVELGARKFYSKKAVNEFMFARMKRGGSFERRWITNLVWKGIAVCIKKSAPDSLQTKGNTR